MLQITEISSDADICSLQSNYTSAKIVSLTEGSEMNVVTEDVVSFIGEYLVLPSTEFRHTPFTGQMRSMAVLVAHACKSSVKWCAELREAGTVSERHAALRAALDATNSETVARAMKVYPLGRAIIKTGEAVTARLEKQRSASSQVADLLTDWQKAGVPRQIEQHIKSQTGDRATVISAEMLQLSFVSVFSVFENKMCLPADGDAAAYPLTVVDDDEVRWMSERAEELAACEGIHCLHGVETSKLTPVYAFAVAAVAFVRKHAEAANAMDNITADSGFSYLVDLASLETRAKDVGPTMAEFGFNKLPDFVAQLARMRVICAISVSRPSVLICFF